MSPKDLSIDAPLQAGPLSAFFADPHRRGFYHNPWGTQVLPSLGDVLRWKTGKKPARPRGYRPQPVPLPAAPLADFDALRGAPTRLFWIGHASFLVEMDGVRLAIDPVFGRAGGLVPRVTPAAATPAELAPLAAVLLTHGHHDHFDKASLRALAGDGGDGPLFIVPKGLAGSLPRQCKRRCELSWWQYVEVDGLRIHLVPAQHWHRRGAFDENRALWGGYVISGTHRVYHSGDTGYFGGFRAIGEVFGGVDVACLPLGAYEPSWMMSPQHMSPAGSLRALEELGARHLLGMHWGSFDLSDEPVDAGPGDLMDEASARGVDRARLHVVRPGGSVGLMEAGSESIPQVQHRFPA